MEESREAEAEEEWGRVCHQLWEWESFSQCSTGWNGRGCSKHCWWCGNCYDWSYLISSTEICVLLACSYAPSLPSPCSVSVFENICFVHSFSLWLLIIYRGEKLEIITISARSYGMIRPMTPGMQQGIWKHQYNHI